MILIEKTKIIGLEPTIRGMRNPMNSWGKSDSEWCPEGEEKCQVCETKNHCVDGFVIGPNDLDLMLRLARAGSVDGKFRRMIAVYVDITAPLYWWKEFDTYKVGTVANSCSTMHKIHAKEFTLEDFSHEHLLKTEGKWIDIDSVDPYEFPALDSMDGLKIIVDMLNHWRKKYLEIDSEIKECHFNELPKREELVKSKKLCWWQMIQLLPSSYNQKRTVMLNYEVLSNIYQHRRNHKLDEWRELCKWIEGLPYSEIITCNVAEAKKAELKTFVDSGDTTPVHGGAFDKPTEAERKEIQELKATINKLRAQKWSEEQITKLLQRAAEPSNPDTEV